MSRSLFPHPSQANKEGVLAIGGDLSIETLFEAYSHGIFPWPHEGYPLLWFCPWERGILEFQNLHIPRSLKKYASKQNWHYTWDRDFASVIRECSQTLRPGQSGTWINNEMITSYENFYKAGYAHSLEVWEEESLIGGIYGVLVKNVFSAESMFYKKSNASKWALWQLVNHLQSLGLKWIDVQMVTPITESFGAHLISQNDFLLKLQQSQK